MSSQTPSPCPGPTPAGRRAALGASVAGFLEYLDGLDAEACDADEALSAAQECERMVASVYGAQVRMLARFAGLRPAVGDRTRQFGEFAADEVAAALAWTRSHAAARLAHAVDMVTRHPEALTALGRGEVDLYRTRILHERTVALTGEQAAQVDAIVLPRAAGQNPTAFRRAVDRAVLLVDPDGEAGRHRVAREGRRVRLVPQPDGMADLTATLPAEHATAIYRRVECIARGLPVGDERSADARRADVFTDLLLGCGLAGGTTSPDQASRPDQATSSDTGTGYGSGTGDLRPLVHVTVAATTLLGLDEKPGDLAGYGPIPASVARAIAADPSGTWRRILTDPADGTLLDHGRRTYRPPAALADQVRTRDGTCRFPGCHHPATTADLDHTVAYPQGETSAGNLGALCRHHHRLKHETQWTVTQQDGTFTWTSPTGRTYTRGPEPLGDNTRGSEPPHQPP